MTTETTKNNEFQDPLENYDAPTYADPLERALAEEPVTAIQTHPYSTIAPETTVDEALHKMAGNEIACLLVADRKSKLVGVFSDRDVMNKVALEYEDVKDRPVSELMTGDPVYVFDTDTASAAICVMAVSGYRHVPVVALDGKLLGIISPQRVTHFLCEHFSNE